ncbi:pectate lyase-like adhesive domain-containing protein [Bilophila wadsworthia]|uniref:pectate lyase-like adhesive domain-containing protein n=1 Tax=Bilophila wadsworthia TaxID=35833 RepID=UPI0032600CF8
MTLSRGAIGNLVNRYRAVLRKCRMMNVFGSLAVAGMLVAGNAGFAGAEDPIIAPNSSISKHYDTNTTVLNTDQPQFSKELYAIGATGSQGALDISMEGDAALTVDASWRRDAADSNRDQLSAVYVGSGAQFSFTGTGLFRATGQGKVMEAVAFRNGANGPTGGTMRLTGAITGEAITEASENGSGYKAIGVKAENAGTIIFSGKSAWLKAMAHAGTADGVYARYGGVVDFQSEEVKVLSQSDTGSAASGISIEYSGGTITSSEQTALTVGVKAPASTATGISLSGASKGLVDLAGSLAVSVEGSPVRGIENDQGTLHVAKASSITGIGEGTFPSYGIWGRNGSSTELRGDVDVNMTSSTTVYGVYADSATVSLGSEGDVAILVQGSLGRGVAAFSGGNVELGSQGKEVSITAQNTGVEAGTSSTVSLNGKVKIDSGTGISLSSTTVDKFPSLLSNGSVSIISAGTGIVAKYAHAVFNELHIQAGTGIDVQSPGYIGSGNTDTVLDVNGPAEIVAQNTALQIVGASGSKSASSGFVGTFNDAASLRASNGNGVQLSASTHSGTTAARDCSVTFKGQTSIASEKGTGVVVNGPVASTAQDGASVVFEGATTIDAAKAIEIKKNNGKGASVTFAYNPTPINVPARAQDADSQVNGSVTGTGTLIKSGGGSLALNGDNSSFSGEFNMQGGRAFLGSGKGYFSGATVNLTGGTLVAPELRFSGGKLLVAGGTLETGTGQIFTSALNADGDMKDPGAVKLSDSNWKFDSGVIAFDDAKYNIVYAQTAAGLLGAGNVAADNASGSGSAKEITFTGTLVELPPGDPDSFETLQKAVLDTGIDSIKLGSDIVLSKRLQGTTPVTRSLTIDGNGHTISGAYPGLWFKGMDSGTVSIQNITFDGLKTSSGDRYEGPVSFGPAIFFDMGYFADNWKSTAKLIIGDGVQFRNTESVGDGAGGAVRTAHGIVEIGNNVSFINCTGGSGGGLYSESFTTIGDNVVFVGNKGRRGGALNVVDDYGGYLTDPNYASGARRVKYVHIGKNALFKNNSVELLGSGGNGGAIEVQSGELSIDDGATFTGNTSKSTGGAIAVCDWSPQLLAKAVLGSATFIQNSAGSYGGAIINEGDVRFNGPVSFVENTAGKIGGAVCNLNTLNMAAESAFSKNTAGVGGGLYNEGIASLGKASFIENAAADGGGAVFNVHQLTFADGAVFSGNSATDGGAVYNDFSADKDGNVVSDGSLTFNGGARFTGNTASGLGGAIYNTRSITLNPGAGQEIVFSGNTDSTGSNAIFMGDGSSLDIMGDGKVVFDDALSSQSATPTLKKTGSGELLLNASMDGFLGTASFEGGLTGIAEKWLIKNLITVAGGKLKMSEFSFASQDAENAVTGGKLVLAGGILETGTGQIFANGLNAEGDARNPGSVKLNGDNWSFDSGLIAFDDAKYNLTYAQAAALLLGASNVGADASGSGSAKEITFTGTYVNIPNPGPISPYYYTGNKSDAASDGTVGGWRDSSGLPIAIADVITVKTEPGQASEYRFLSGVYDGSKTSDTSETYACLIHGGDSGVRVTSDGPLTIQNWGTGLMPYHASVASSNGEILFGDNVSLLNNHSAGDATKGGGAIFSKKGVTFGDNAVLSGNSTALAIGGGGYGGGAIFLDGKGVVRFGKNAVIANNESYHYGGAIYSLGSVSMGEGATVRGNTTSYMGGAIAVTGALSLGTGSVVESNQAQAGGAVYSTGQVNATGTTFRKNVATSNYGGGIYSAGGSIVLVDSRMEENKAAGGGAIILAGGGTASVMDTAFAANTATNGGAFFIDKNGVLTTASGGVGTDAGTLFDGNSATTNGGAVYVQNGTVDLGSGTRLQGNQAAKGGAIYALGGKDASAKLTFAGTVFGKNSGTYGGAVYSSASVGGTVNAAASDVVFEGNTATSGGAVYLGGSGTSDIAFTDAVFKENQANTGNGGAIYSAISGSSNLAIADSTFEGNNAGYGGAVFNNGQLTTSSNVVFSGNMATYGGAVYNYFTSTTDGSLTFNGGARFTGNTASGFGGAIYNTRSITLNPGAGQEIVFSGNTDSTGSNAIFMGDGSSLDIMGDGKVVFDDALSSQSATPTLKKTGSGELLLNASMDGFLGTASFEGGRTEIVQKWLIKNTVTITGGRLKMPEFSFAVQGEGNNVAGGKLILAGGILETGTGQIFTNGLNAEGGNKDPGAVKLSGDNWSFDSGLIAFNDALYNLTYAQAAADSLGANNVEAGEGAGSTSAKEITFIGTGYVDPDPDPVPPVDPDPDPVPPVDPDPDPVPPVDPDPTPPAPEPKPDEDRTGKVSVDELNNNHANNIVLGNVTITTGTSSDSGKDFVVGASATDDKTDSISGSIGGKNIDLGSSGRNISVVGGHYLTLVGGSSDTPLVTAGGNPVNVHVGGTGEGASGVLNLGTPVMDSGGTLSGNIEIAAASTVNVRAGTHVITGEANETTGTADVAGMNNNGGTINIAEGAHLQSTIRQADGQTNVSGRLTSASVELSGGGLNVSGAVDSSSVTASKGDIKVAGTLAADVLTTSSDVQINIGDQGSAGRVVARQVQLQGGRVFLDPAWKGNDALTDASHGVFTFVNNEIDGLLTAGQNSLLVLGDTDTGWALDAFGRSSLQWGQNGVTAALAIRKPQTLNGTLGAVMVDGTKTSAPVLTPNTATFTDGSLLLVDGSGLNGAAALTSQGGTLNVDAGAKLLIDNITQGEYAITSGFSVSSVQGWNGDNLSTPDNLIGLVLGKDADGSMKIQATARRSSDVFRGLSLVNTMDAIWGKGLNDTESDSMGIRFLSRAVNENYLPKADTVHTVDGAAQIAVAGGVQGMAVAAADAPVRAIQDHASLLHMTATREGAVRKDGLNLWINALYGAEHARNFGAGSLDGGYNADFGGIVFGGDYAFGDFRVGMALNAGSGTARSRGDFNATKNDFDFWGVNLYGSWSRDQFNIVGDLGYSANKNEVKQDLPTTMQLGQLRGDVDTGVLTAGLRGEYRFETDWADVTPHVGVRYYNLRTDGFTSRIDEHDVFRVGRDTQEIWTFPIGVSFSRDFETSSGWKVKPRADLSVVPAAGDLKAKTKARVPGVAASDTIKARMMDSVSFDGTLGLEVQKDNISFGLDYGIRASEHKTGHGVNVSFTYKF